MARLIRGFLTLIMISMAFSACVSLQTANPTERKIVVPELGGKTTVGKLQYEIYRFPVDKFGYFEPGDNDKMLAVLTIQAERIDRKVLYDFYNIALTIGERKVYPRVIRYYRGDEKEDPDGGFQQEKKEMITVKFKESGSYKILLAYLYEEGEVFDGVVFYDSQAVPFKAEMKQEASRM